MFHTSCFHIIFQEQEHSILFISGDTGFKTTSTPPPPTPTILHEEWGFDSKDMAI